MDRVLIIAEAGVNHNADINIAKKLIDVAKEAGADIPRYIRIVYRQHKVD
jgi:N,N'-diacetyllegionaminate synthase